MKTTLKKHLLNRFRTNWKQGNHSYINSQIIQDVMNPITGKKHETIGRELRLLAEEGLLQKEIMKKKGSKVASVYYKYIPTEHEQVSMFMGGQIK